MVSKCPSCKRDIEHEDFLFEVQCTCGVRFNPFMPVEVEASPMGEAPFVEQNLSPAPETVEPIADFSESNAVFQELRDFGETMGTGQVPPPPAAPPKASAASPRTFAPLKPGDETPVTAGDSLPGFAIEAHLFPVSVWISIDPTNENPMLPVFEGLWQRATAAGGNGLVSLRWELASDGQKVLASATPVRCGRLSEKV